jgi:hypothetical protein
MNDGCGEVIEIIKQHESFLLIRAGARFAVIEQRAGRAYPMKPGEREGGPLTPDGSAAGWRKGLALRGRSVAAFRELCDRGDRLARSFR